MKLQKMNINLKTNIMKTTIQKLGMIICSFLFLVSCTKKDEGQIVVPTDTTPISATSMLKFSGSFVSKVHTGAGSAKIYQDGNAFTLKFENFSVDNGPDLKVYLAKDETKDNIVNLGGIKTTGSYDIPATAVVSDYKYVLIYCQQYSVLFSSASLTAVK
jgi:Electron transfer DM13